MHSARLAGWFPDQEQQVYMDFYYRRIIERLDTDWQWITDRMLTLMVTDKPVGWEKFCTTSKTGWEHRFRKRWRITSRVVTNTHELDVRERLPVVRDFHHYWLSDVQNGPYRDVPGACPIYGRFPARRIYAMDQHPLAFAVTRNSTLHPKGKKRVGRSTPGGPALEKRQCTFQLCLCGDPRAPAMRIAIIHKCKTGTHIPRAEKDYYASVADKVFVGFQRNGWADGKFMMRWLRECFFEDTRHIEEEVCLAMDQHGAQMTDEFQEEMALNSVFPLYTPADCTDCVSPCDHHIGQAIKKVVAQLYKAELALRGKRWWTEILNTSGRRMLMTKWVLIAWEALQQDRSSLLASFVNTGLLVPKDGSRDHLIALEGLEPEIDGPYQFR
jgi:hypothetical protein